MKLTQTLYVIYMCIWKVVSVDDSETQCFVGTSDKVDLISCIRSTSTTVAHQMLPLNISTSPEDDNNATQSVSTQEISYKQAAPSESTVSSTFVDVPAMSVESDGHRGRPNSCLVFLPKNNTGNETGVAVVEFGCDLDGICEENYKYRFNHRDNVTYRGQPGDLYCCRGTGCNRHHQAFPIHSPTLSERPLHCSAGRNVKDFILCPNETLACFNQTMSTDDSSHDLYGCDLAYYCARPNLQNDTCMQFQNGVGQQLTLCCCFTNNCNAPPEIITEVDAPLNFAALGNIEWITYGWIGIVATVGIVSAIVLVVKWRRNRMYSEISIISDPRYQRLTANFIAGDTDDVKMLLAD